jgi:hypothetical protein
MTGKRDAGEKRIDTPVVVVVFAQRFSSAGVMKNDGR